MKIQLARRHAIEAVQQYHPKKMGQYAAANANLLDALDLPIFMEEISPDDPLLQKLKQEEENNSPQICQEYAIIKGTKDDWDYISNFIPISVKI
ncbi:MAG: hypothetical protein EOP45_19085 [Sphingobacteriaceae bacterium]|nr:MAG: hypothetical protein EOP45_19085 [Sphingobacteriaceae bacterium]